MKLKLLLGVIGFIFGKFFGAILGVFIAHLLANFKIKSHKSNRRGKNKKNFNDSKEAGDYGEKLLESELKYLTGSLIFNYMTSENILFDNKNFEIDFLLMIPKVGLAVVEVKYHSGKVYCTNNDSWKQINSNGVEVNQKNASKQVLRARSLLKSLLASHSMNKWPILPLVVFTHQDAVIYKAKESQKPQTEIIKNNMLQTWITNQIKNDSIDFSDLDFQSINQILKSAEKEYKEVG